jgi:hypothetical protein
MNNKHWGSCLCGEVRFEILGEFERFFLCHCGRCRKGTGSAHAANLFSSTAKVNWLSGQAKIKTFRLANTRHQRSFCSECGSAVPNVQMNGALLMVPAGSLDSVVEARPDAHICVASSASWDRHLEDVPRIAATPMKKATAMQRAKADSRKGVPEDSSSHEIDARIATLGDWRGETLARVRKLIKEADPEIVEKLKWRKPSNPMGVPVWEHDGIVCTGETYKDKVKLTFARGASLKDSSGLFNSSLEGNLRRAIDFYEGDKIDEKALKALFRAAVALNVSAVGKAPPARARRKPKSA